MLKAVFIILSCLFFCELQAQNDSLQVSSLLSQKRKVQECLLPASLITVGVISNATFINRYVQRQAYHYSGGEKLRFDDYIQYVPLASVFAFSNLGVKPKHTIKERLIVGATAYAIRLRYVDLIIVLIIRFLRGILPMYLRVWRCFGRSIKTTIYG